MQSVLDAAGIAYEIRNDAVARAIPGLEFNPEIWLVHDEDYDEALRLISSSSQTQRED
jgi:hypothetical protein